MNAALAMALLLVPSGRRPSQTDDGTPSGRQRIQPDPAWKKLGRSLWFDPKEKRLYLRAQVVLREGYLEHLMCSKGTKEHEAILATDAVPQPDSRRSSPDRGRAGPAGAVLPEVRAADRQCDRDRGVVDAGRQGPKAGCAQVDQRRQEECALERDWVFAGSQLYDDPITKKRRYAADDGDLITVANFASAILDLPIESSANDADRTFSTNTEKIPPVGTEVFLSLSPRPNKAATKPVAKAAKSQ